ncbi:hypothetical protein [Enterococcus gilvus]|uniref:hypothetical protein n=1 Tax=Enterococcus gilvus TaxID=160453 RepID=UPI001C8B5DFA|nr:hypothetical protein [Enterococcus gilvus]MBX8937478.1 hypothetical protein [Enterococcus gilvus]
MNEHGIVPPIQPNDFIDANIQQAVQNVSIEERQANVGIEKHKNKNKQDVLIVVADPKPVVLEEELADKKEEPRESNRVKNTVAFLRQCFLG